MKLQTILISVSLMLISCVTKEIALPSYELGMTKEQFLSEYETVSIFDKSNNGIVYIYKDCEECSEKYFTFIDGKLKAVTGFHYGLDKMSFN